jgi:hypothetical protein
VQCHATVYSHSNRRYLSFWATAFGGQRHSAASVDPARVRDAHTGHGRDECFLQPPYVVDDTEGLCQGDDRISDELAGAYQVICSPRSTSTTGVPSCGLSSGWVRLPAV